jgi:RNA polymerase subunit RPABC4/transcription elongation factor Spt4
MRLVRLFFMTLGMLCFSSANAELINIQDAIEASDIDVTVHGPGDGYVLARSCTECPFTRLVITPETRVWVNGEPVRADRRIQRNWSGGVVIFDTKSKQVVRLRLF